MSRSSEPEAPWPPTRDGELELRGLLDALPVLVSYLVVDGPDVRYRFVNKPYETWFPLKREEIIGRRLRDVLGEAAYDRVEPYVQAALGGERLSLEQLMPYANGPARHVRIEYAPNIAEGKVVGIYTLVEDITQTRTAEAALRESEEDFRYAAELNPQVAWTAQPDGQLDRVAPRWKAWTGQSGLGSSYAEGLHPDDVERTFQAWGRSIETGEPYDIVHRVRRIDGEIRWIRSRAFPRRDTNGRVVRWYGTTEDIHEQKAAEDHLKLMVLELNHRVKNNLATVQAIAQQTLRGAPEASAQREVFLERITALAAAHDILTREQWNGAAMADVARGVLDALTGGSERLTIQGPTVRLSSSAALSLAMAFYELATNALKHGALSRPEGSVTLTWRSAPEGATAISWIERGGPLVTAPAGRGFGSRLLAGVARELNGEVDLRFEPSGVVCQITAVLDRPSPAPLSV